MKTKKNKCLKCGRSIHKPSNMSIRRYNEIQFCSMKCYKDSKKLVNECKNCGKDVVTTHNSNKLFCDMTCRKEWHKKENSKCAFCGEAVEINTPLKFGRKRFCSHKCFIDEKGKDFVRLCERCGYPLYNKCGNYKEYKLIRKHKKCKPYMID